MRARRLDRMTRPVVDALRAHVDEPGALDRFWGAVELDGTPVIEPAGPARCTVTFLARGGDDIDAVTLIANKLAGAESIDECRLERLEGTDVWWLALEMDPDWRASYGLAVTPKGVVAPRHELNDVRRQRALADALPQPWLAAPVAKGCRATLTVRSHVLGNEREVVVHVPDARPASDWPLLVLLDGETWDTPPIAAGIEAAVAAGVIPPLLTVMVPSLGFAERVAELTCNQDFVP